MSPPAADVLALIRSLGLSILAAMSPADLVPRIRPSADAAGDVTRRARQVRSRAANTRVDIAAARERDRTRIERLLAERDT